jgi:hypothetical protein
MRGYACQRLDAMSEESTTSATDESGVHLRFGPGLLVFATAVLVFGLSLVLGPYYTEGDQIHYRLVYEMVANLGLEEAFAYYTSRIDSYEVVHFFLIWLASGSIEKDLFAAISNAILGGAMMALLQRWRASIIVSLIVILTNYYFIVLYFSAERLKFGVLFAALAMLYTHDWKRFSAFTGLAFFSHIQIALFYGAVAFSEGLKVFQLRISRWTLLILLLLALPVFLLGDHIAAKFETYHSERGLSELLKMAAFMALAFFYSNQKRTTVAVFVPLLVAVFLIGGDRVNVFGYLVFLYYGVQVRNGLNLGILLTAVYYGYAGYAFINNILRYGTGYVSSL